MKFDSWNADRVRMRDEIVVGSMTIYFVIYGLIFGIGVLISGEDYIMLLIAPMIIILAGIVELIHIYIARAIGSGVLGMINRSDS